MAEQDIRQLFAKYVDGSVSKGEYRALLRHFRLPEHADDVDQLLYRAIAKESGEAPVSEAELEEVMDAAYQKVRWRIAKRNRNAWRLLPYAAAVAALLAVGWLFLDNRHQTTDNRLAGTEILPGGNRATLMLADGRTIALSEAQTGIVVGDGITYLDGTQILDNRQQTTDNRQADGKESLVSSVSSLLSLTTPKGGTYQVTLPDGSKVWLNANSTLKYPSRFSGAERVVHLEGEAYFEVSEQVNRGTSSQAHKLTSSQKIPFKVISNGQVVEVLGTQFNISAYADDPETKTTLVEGKVRVSRLTTNDSQLTTNDSQLTTNDSRLTAVLTPGEQATLRGAAIETKPVDTDPYTAWRESLFMFDHEPLESILRKVARWYDVTIRYEQEDLRHELFSGTVSRFENASEVLDILALTELASFHIADRTIVVSAPVAAALSKTKNEQKK